METQQNLFGPSSDFAATFSEAVATLSQIVTPILWKAHKDVFADFGERLLLDAKFQRLQHGERAQWLHRQIIEDARQLLCELGRGTVHRWQKVQSMDLLCIENVGTIGFKRLRKDLRRSNYDTEHNGQYWSQPIANRDSKIIIGYRPNEKWNDANIYLTLPSGPARGPVLEYVHIDDQTDRLIQLASSTPTAELPVIKSPQLYSLKVKEVRDSRKNKNSDAG